MMFTVVRYRPHPPTSQFVRVQAFRGDTFRAWGRRPNLRVGPDGDAVGSPARLGGTVTTGLVRRDEPGPGVDDPVRTGNQKHVARLPSQTDARDQPRNRWRGLVNMEGEMVGVNSGHRHGFGGGGDLAREPRRGAGADRNSDLRFPVISGQSASRRC